MAKVPSVAVRKARVARGVKKQPERFKGTRSEKIANEDPRTSKKYSTPSKVKEKWNKRAKKAKKRVEKQTVKKYRKEARATVRANKRKK